MKWAVLGASGIGQYHFRELVNLTCDVVAILGKTEESSRKTMEVLERVYGKKVHAYGDINKLLNSEKIDSVIVSTPPETHYDLVKLCLLKKINVFCEKPLVISNIADSTKELLDLARKNEVTLNVNNQWPAFLQNIKVPENIISFKLISEPGLKDRALLFDHLSHANSLLVKLIPNGFAEDISFPINEKELISVKFNYGNQEQKCKVDYVFKFKECRPRNIEFLINDSQYKKVIGGNYQQSLQINDSIKEIDDPFSTSIQKFVDSIKYRGTPLVSEIEILENSRLQEDILKKYDGIINKGIF